MDSGICVATNPVVGLSQNLGDSWLGYHCVIGQEAYTFENEQCEKCACVTSVEYGLALSADLT